MERKIIINFFLLSLIILTIFLSIPLTIATKELIDWLFFSFVPGLLPMMLLLAFFSLTHGFDLLAFIIQKPSFAILGIDGFSTLILFASILGGFPLTALMTIEMIKKGNINAKEGPIYLYSLALPSIGFLVNTLSLPLSNLFLLWLPSFIFLKVGLGSKAPNFISLDQLVPILSQSSNFRTLSIEMTTVVKKAILSIAQISGIIFLFSLPLFLIIHYFPLPQSIWISSVLEFSRPSYLAFQSTHFSYQRAIALAILPWGGLSMWMQLFVLYPFPLSIKKLIKYRFSHAILVFVLAWLLL